MFVTKGTARRWRNRMNKKIKIMYVKIPNNAAKQELRIMVKEYHQTRRGLKKNPDFEWYKKFPHEIKEIDE